MKFKIVGNWSGVGTDRDMGSIPKSLLQLLNVSMLSFGHTDHRSAVFSDDFFSYKNSPFYHCIQNRLM
jgi:hypothetical protein